MPDLSRFASRLVPSRGDLAAPGMAGERRVVTAALLDLTAAPDPDAERATQLLRGEAFTVYAERGGLAWGQAEPDLYVGWVKADGLAREEATTGAARRVTALRSHVYPAPKVQARPAAVLHFGSTVGVVGEADGWAHLAGGAGFVPASHLQPLRDDFVALALRFAGVPYLWGGRSTEGLDCSALVQLALGGAGIRSPRDSDMQEALVGLPVGADEPAMRGDLVFWRGHVGIMRDAVTLIHANAHAMAVTAEPLGDVEARVLRAGGGPVTGRRRGAAQRADWLSDE